MNSFAKTLLASISAAACVAPKIGRYPFWHGSRAKETAEKRDGTATFERYSGALFHSVFDAVNTSGRPRRSEPELGFRYNPAALTTFRRELPWIRDSRS